MSAPPPSPAGGPGRRFTEGSVFYRAVLSRMDQMGVPFLVGGARALCHYTGICRDTKDLDLFLRREDQDSALALLQEAGFAVERTAPHWLAKGFAGEEMIDLIFGLANGLGRVDDDWFTHAIRGEALGTTVRFVPVEEMIWSKAFIMERERFDGADIIHLIRARGDAIHWDRLVARFGPHWRVLLSHLVLFGFVYPAERTRVPPAVMTELTGRLLEEAGAPSPDPRAFRGTLISRYQYAVDLERDRRFDARLFPVGNLTPEQASQ